MTTSWGICSTKTSAAPSASQSQGSGDPDLALFPTLQSGIYRSGTENDFDLARIFGFGSGDQDFDIKGGFNGYSWAVRAGNVGALPVPAAVWLFGSGLIGLLGLARRERRHRQGRGRDFD